MKIAYDGTDYEFDLDEITNKQAQVIYVTFERMTLLDLEAGLAAGNPNALTAIFWLMLTQSGVKIAPADVDFKIVKFGNAVQEAYNADLKAKAVAEKAEKRPKESKGVSQT